MTSFPICKSCSFLAIDFYEEISNNFEDCLSEALIPESTFLSNENSSGVLTVDKSHRFPWKNTPFDEAFVSCEANKVEESIRDITENTAVFPNKFNWNYPHDYSSSSKDFNEEEILHEKDLSIFRGKVLHGKFQLLDVPQIPFPLLRTRKHHSSFETLLNIFPIMELDDPFDFEDTSFEDNDTFFNVELNEEMTKFAKSDYEMNFEELTLPEITVEEKSMCENLQYNIHFKDVSEIHAQKDTILKLPNSSLPDPDGQISDHLNETCYSYSSIALNNHITSERSPKCDLQSSWDINKTEEFTFCKDISNEDCGDLETNVGNTSNEECGQNMNCLSNDIYKQSQHLNRFPSQQKLSGNTICRATFNVDNFVGDIPEDKNEDHSVENLLINLNSNIHKMGTNIGEFNIEFEKSDYQDNSCIVPIKELIKLDFHQYSNNPEDQIKMEENPILGSQIIASYKETLSNLQYPANTSIKNISKSVATKKKAPIANYPNHCTAVRSQVSTCKPANKNSNNNVNKMSSQNIHISQPVDLLSNFIHVQFPFQKLNKELDGGSLKEPSMSPFNKQLQSNSLVSRLQVKELEPSVKDVREPISNHFHEESIPMLVQLNVEDLHVELPEDFVKIVLYFEDTAIPLLQYLMASGQFKFPAYITLADIPPYKTCFLLNQEVKRCQDKHIDKRNMGDYYYHLLLLHGILKTMECLIHFDVHLALSLLYTYDTTHKGFIKRFYEKLIEKLEHEIDECFQNDSVHPKVKELSRYLCEKYKFCKENHLKFKALIILKKNLEAVYAAFEKVLKQNASDFRISLIPESVFLHPNTLIFNGIEETVYFINASSLSNNIPWTEFSFVIEYEPDHNSCWKQICNEQNIAHAFVKIVKLPLKSLKEIQNLKASVPKKAIVNPAVENVKLLIVSSSITSQYQLLYLLESRFQYSICIRQYKEVLSHLHFADIVVDERSAIILVSDVSFSVENFVETLYERISFLHIKFEICWIIVQKYIDKKSPDVSKFKRAHNNFLKFYLSMVNFCCRNQTYKIKLLFANNVDETTDLIKHISCISQLSKRCENVNISVSSQITEEEIFLCSFPSLNPFVVNLMLFESSLSELLNFTAEEMCKKFYSVPERFLQCFYSTSHKLYTLPSPEKYEEHSEFSENSSHESSSGSNSKFQLRPNLQTMVNYSQEYSNVSAIRYEHGESADDVRISSQLPEYTTEIPLNNEKMDVILSHEKSLQELDLDYMSLKICNKFEEYQSSYDDEEDNNTPPEHKASDYFNMYNSFTKENQQSGIPFTFETLSSQISNNSYLDFDDNVEFVENIDNSYNQLVKVRSKSDFMANKENLNFEHAVPISQFHTNCNIKTSQQTIKRPTLEFNQFKYNPNSKRKLSSNDGSPTPVPSLNFENEVPISQFHTKSIFDNTNSQQTIRRPSLEFNQCKYNPTIKRKLSTNDDSPPQVSKKACRIQKGMASKTVSKRDAIYKSPFDSQEIISSKSPNRKEAKVFPFMIRKNCYESSKNITGRTSTSVGVANIFESHQLSQWPDSEPMKSFPLTPKINRRLGFEGASGQTKLVFQ